MHTLSLPFGLDAGFLNVSSDEWFGNPAVNFELPEWGIDEPTMRQFQRVKDAFDPDVRINAGKLIPSDKIKVNLIKPGRHVPQ